MYRNLEAEQSRYGFTNADMAKKLGVCTKTYENKKKDGSFTLQQAIALLELFSCDFYYLFSVERSA